MIKLQNDYSILSDGTQYTLTKKVIREKKETKEKYEAEQVIGYYSELSQALNGYVRFVMLDKTKSESVSLYQVLDMLKELKEEIKAYE